MVSEAVGTLPVRIIQSDALIPNLLQTPILRGKRPSVGIVLHVLALGVDWLADLRKFREVLAQTCLVDQKPRREEMALDEADVGLVSVYQNRDSVYSPQSSKRNLLEPLVIIIRDFNSLRLPLAALSNIPWVGNLLGATGEDRE